MTPGQTRVLGLLAALFALHLLINPTFRGNVLDSVTFKGTSHPVLLGYAGWGGAAVALVALAEPAPNAATWIVIAFILMALIQHPQAWTSALGSVTQGLGALTGQTGTTDTINRNQGH